MIQRTAVGTWCASICCRLVNPGRQDWRRAVTLAAVFYICHVAGARPAVPDQINFNRDIRPILSSACFSCHGPDANKRQAGLRLDQRESVFVERNGKPILIPGDPSDSALYRRITSTAPDRRMPPMESGQSLTAAQITLLRRWIEQGADWQAHWSFMPPQRPPEQPRGHSNWARNAIDEFVLTRLNDAGLEASPEADKRTLLRRLSLDLTGLPPTLAEVNAFLADDGRDSYDKVVDRLLMSPAYGERMALNWLDAARYADTHGYHEDYHRDMWPWRDWVIDSFNANMPFDQFTIEQLAGDLLPDRTDSQIVATGFNRNHGVTASGISEEYRVEYVLDRVRTTSTVWLGLTMHCAQCHDHKYDPISQKEFYQFFALFNSITDKGVENRSGNVDPLLKVESPELFAKLAELQQDIAGIEAAKQRRELAVSSDELAAWERGFSASGSWSEFQPADGLQYHYPLDSAAEDTVTNAVAQQGHGRVIGHAEWTTGRIGNALQCDGTAYVDLGDAAGFERTDAFSYGAWILATNAGAVIARMDDGAAYRGWDVFVAGKYVEAHMIHQWPDNALHARAKDPLNPEQWNHVFVTYDGSSQAQGLRIYVNGTLQDVDVTRDRLTDSIRTEKPLHIGRRNPSAFFSGAIDDVRIYSRTLSANEVAALAASGPAMSILRIARIDRTAPQNDLLRHHYLSNYAAEYMRLSAELDQLRVREKELSDESSKLTVMVMKEMETPRSTFVLERGQYDQHGETVQPGIPTFLPEFPESTSSNRLTLARWLVDPGHPLTSRVAVNRMWQMIFGTGIVKTSEDFGTQGELPTHPELLDWLATEFVRAGWDMKQILKLIVTSATYRQSSRFLPHARDRDPENRLLSRGPRFRLPAELIRDNALAAGGLLVEHVGGPSVKGYQPPGLWKETSNRGYEQDHGKQLYRRSLYSYWKRSVPPPNLFAIDAPTRETCIVRRQRTNTPLMALVMLNDPTFVEASRALAERAMTARIEPGERIGLMFERATSRRPRPAEGEILLTVYRRQQRVFAENHAAAVKLLAVGESKRSQSLNVAEHAALTTVASIILNLDETITKE
ncbi:MAG: DUF1553 domain-containing protein [Planctomycetaceae bacterium]